MTEAFASALALLQPVLWTFFLVFLRLGAMIATLPAFGEQTLPARLKVGIAAAFCLIVHPVVAAEIPAMPATLVGQAGLGGTEVLIGLIFGLLLRFFIFALQIAGVIAAQSTSLSQIFGGTAGVDPLPAIGHVLVVAGLALAALMGLHVAFAAYMIQSYALVPAGGMLAPGPVAQIGTGAVSQTFSLAFRLAAPFVIASLLYNVILGVINKAMPQLMVSFVGAPAITAGSLIILWLAAPTMLALWLEAFSRAIAFPGAGLP